jgi:hypothetical protein
MGKKAETTEIINEVINCLDDTSESVQYSAYNALGKIGKKAATSEVIDRLLYQLPNISNAVADSAWKTLMIWGENAATNKVIDRLLHLLDHSGDGGVRILAATALSKMGEKAATNQVIEALIDAFMHHRHVAHQASMIMEKILNLSSCMSYLKDETVQKIAKYIQESDREFLKSISPEKIMETLLETKLLSWLPIIRDVFTLQGYSITITGMIIKVYGRRKPVEISCTDIELCQQLHNYLVTRLDRSLEGSELAAE